MLDDFLGRIFPIVLAFPPLLLFRGWYSWSKAKGRKDGPQWRSVLRDIALIGATLQFLAFWAIYISLQNLFNTDQWRGFEIWGTWAEVAIVSSIVFIALAIVGKGVARIPTIISCIALVFGLLIVNP